MINLDAWFSGHTDGAYTLSKGAELLRRGPTFLNFHPTSKRPSVQAIHFTGIFFAIPLMSPGPQTMFGQASGANNAGSSSSTNGKLRTVPIDKLEDLLAWHPSTVDRRLAGKDLNPYRDNRNGKRKLLVCHDMAGGYLDDALADGYDVPLEGDSPFYVVHWQYIHSFVYFSHHLVTIPPVNWIDAAHRNGVLILGTFITEFDDGSKICKNLFSDDKKWRTVVGNLTMMAKTYNFDGWLLNIENPIEPEHLPRLQEFVSELRRECRSSLGEKSMVIWYDSVIAGSGRLKWQDELNALNRSFFSMSDGIFLNYGWSKNALSSSLKIAGQRADQVYVGVDCFGRGCYGDGGFNCDAALQVIRNYAPLSVALFAPGWVYEKKELRKEQFVHNWHKFWTLIANELGCYPSIKPLRTQFNNGCLIVENRREPTIHVQLGYQGQQAHLCCSPCPDVYNQMVSDWQTGTTCIRFRQRTSKRAQDYRLMCFDLHLTRDTSWTVEIRVGVRSPLPPPSCLVSILCTLDYQADPMSSSTSALTAEQVVLSHNMRPTADCRLLAIGLRLDSIEHAGHDQELVIDLLDLKVEQQQR